MNSLPTLESLVNIKTWNCRYREMQELLPKSPEARKLIVDALIIIKTQKDLSFGERKMLDSAQNWDSHMRRLQENLRKSEVTERRSKFHIVKT